MDDTCYNTIKKYNAGKLSESDINHKEENINYNENNINYKEAYPDG